MEVCFSESYQRKWKKWTCKSADKENGQAVNTAKGNMSEQEGGLSDWARLQDHWWWLELDGLGRATEILQ